MAEFAKIMKQYKRMCSKYAPGECEKCPLNDLGDDEECHYEAFGDPETFERIVTSWAKEHPAKTNAEKFKEIYGIEPNTRDCPVSGKYCKKYNFECNECEYKNFWHQEYKEPESEKKHDN